MTPAQRAVYDESEARGAPGRRRRAEAPETGELPVSRFERDRAEAAYLLDLEEWDADNSTCLTPPRSRLRR
ncbi:MAG: hypothetical protein V8S24_07150 [Gordonibacter pamelaeae]